MCEKEASAIKCYPCAKYERMNPFYVGPYPDQACGSCPYGIFSGFVPCGWPNRCADKNKQPKECEAKETKDAKQTNGAKETASPKECD